MSELSANFCVRRSDVRASIFKKLNCLDQDIWEKYQLTRLAGDLFKTNTAIIEKRAAATAPVNYQDPTGPFSGEDNSIPALMRRGAVFMSCHNAIWEHAAALIETDVNPDKLCQSALAAELTNAVLIPGARWHVARIAARRLSLRKGIAGCLRSRRFGYRRQI